MKIIIAGTIILAFIEDSSGTIRLVAKVLSIGGMTWIIKKIIKEINTDASQIIEFAGYSIAGVSAVQILGRALNSMGKVSGALTNIAEIVDKLTFWN